jgi:hypothetical protein
VGKNGASTEERSRAEIEARLAAVKLGELLRNRIVGFGRAYIVRTAPYIGVRETRRILGEYELEASDAIDGEMPDDTIAVGGYPIDIHDPTDGIAEFTGLKKGCYGIPYRCLIPRGVRNLLVSGRAISATHDARGATRVMGTCLALGEACGHAAYHARRQSTEVSDLDGRTLRKRLEEERIILP